jgi:hypothetical protein
MYIQMIYMLFFLLGREEIDYTIQFEKLSKSIATVGNGFSKVCAGFGLKIISQEEKDAAEAREKKVVEAKKVAEQKIIAEEKTRAAELSATQFEEWKKKEEDEKRKVEKDKEKERRTDLLLSIPGHMVNISSVLDGLAEITSGSKEVVASVSIMVRNIPSLMRRIHGGTEGAVGESAQSRSMGTGSLGLRLALDRQVITRSYDGRVCVLDGFGEKKEIVPRAFGGRLLIHNIEELNSAIFDFQNGKLRQLIDIDHNHVSLVVARDMWRLLCNEQLTGLLRPDSLLPEMALRAAALLDEETALQSHLEDAKKSVNELTSSISELRNKLEMSVDGMSVVQQTLKAKGK